MYQNRFHKVISMAMAFLVLLSTLSFSMEKHFCGDTLIDTAFFSKATDCGMDMDVVAKSKADKNNCCKDEVEIVKGQDKLKKASFEDLQFDQQVFVFTLIYSFIIQFESYPTRAIPHKNYSPPILVADIHVLDQVFII